jgi:gliding motility-associated-like protein
MKRIYIIITLLSVFSIYNAQSQNLVLNPDFETVNAGSLKCSWYLSNAEFIAAISNWTIPTGGSTDIFSTTLATSCFCSTNSTHASAKGPQAPRSGNTYVGIVVYGSGGCTPYREYAQGQLSSSLVPGQQYCIEFYVSMADYNTYATNNIGMYFTTAAVSSGSMCVYNVTPQLNHSGAPITNSTGWALMSFTFTPTAAYNYFMIGNFYSDAATTTTNVGGANGTCRYYVEDVSVELCVTGPVITVNNPTICSGGTATITASSSIAGTTYLWNTGSTTNPLIVSPAVTTTYTVTGTAPSGQTGTASATVTVLPNPIITASATPTTICVGSSSTISATSSVSGTTYNWSTGSTTNPITVSPGATTTYTVTGTTASGCTGTASVTVTVNPNPTITASATNMTICEGENTTISGSSTIGGTTYTWDQGLGAGTSHIVSPAITTTYTVTGSTASGCSGTANVTITVNPNPTITASATNMAICEGENTTISGSSTISGTTYTWDQGLGAGISHIVSPAVTTTYTVTGTSGTGCSGTANLTITVNPNPTITASASPTAICIGTNSTISATSNVGGTTYNWDQGLGAGTSHIVSPAVTTTYTVTGSTATGCTGTSQVTVTVNSSLTPTITASSPSICEGSSTSLTAGNVPVGSTYNWSTGSTLNPINVSPLTSTTYQVTATDGNGCTGTASINITVNPNPVISPTATPAGICLGTNSTIAATSSVGGTTYSWSGLGAGTSHIVSPTVSTTYTVTGTTSNGCTGTSTVTVIVNPNPTISAIASPDSICSGTSSTLTSSSTIGSTTYAWSNGATTNTQSVSPTINTTYTVTGTTANGCTGTATVSVYLKPDILPVITASSSSICLGNSSDITVSNIPSGTSFIWDNSSTTNPLTVSPLVTTTYSVTATTLEGCTGTTDIQVVVTPLPQIQVVNDTVCNGDIGSLLASGASTYLWSNTTTANPLTDNPSVTTIYTVTGTDGNGCSSTGQGEIYVVDPPTLVLSSIDAHCNQNDGSVSVVASGGTGVYTYSWNTTPVSTASTVNNVPPGTYSVSVTYNGCTSISSINVGNISGPTAAFVADPTEANINEDIIFTDLSIGAISWDWNFGDGGSSIIQHPTHAYASQGIYDVWLYIEDNFGCTDSTSSRIIINTLFTIYIPNAFSPDGNGVNEIFIPSGVGIDEDRYVMQIYDRWGNRIFETEDIGEGWDGSVDGQEISEIDKMSAVFVYYIKLYEEGTDVSHEYRGTITLLK